MLVRGKTGKWLTTSEHVFGLGFLLEFSFVNKEPTALKIQCDSKPEFVCKGNKRITQKMETVMAGCSVQVQCTFTWVKSITRQPLLKCWLSKQHARRPNLHAVVFPQLQDIFFCFCFFGSCTLHLVKRRRMSRILVFNDASAVFQRSCKMYPLYRNLQHVVYQDWMGGTQWHSTDI